MEETVTISNRDLVEYVTLERKKSEADFKRNFLVRNGASVEDYHVKALTEAAAELNRKLSPIKIKLEKADVLRFTLHSSEISKLSSEIDSYPAEQREEAIVSKSGPIYEKMKRRGVLSKQNFERKEDIARLTILLNGMPRADAEMIKGMLEEGESNNIDVAHLEFERQQQVVNLLNRLGLPAYVIDGTLTTDKKLAEDKGVSPDEEVKRMINGRAVWIAKDRVEAIDENEKRLAEVGGKIQAMTAKHTVEEFSIEGQQKFDELQQEYIDGLKMRNVYLTSADPYEEVAVPLKKENVNEAKMKS
jgi:predicted RNA-binding protein YlxR (DUF448 family)